MDLWQQAQFEFCPRQLIRQSRITEDLILLGHYLKPMIVNQNALYCWTIIKIISVRSIDGTIIREDEVGLLTQRLTNLYWVLHQGGFYSKQINYKD